MTALTGTDPRSGMTDQELSGAGTERDLPPMISSDRASTAMRTASRSTEAIPDSSTQSTLPDQDLYELIESLFRCASSEVFDDGMESEFSKSLVSAILKHGKRALEPMAHLLIFEKTEPESASEALRWVGKIEHRETYSYRRWILERCLLCSSPSVRDGTGLGLASLNDPHAIPYLKQAIRNELFTELREDLEQVLTELESPRAWPVS